MDLKEWLTKKKILQVEFARQIGINPLYLSLILKKKRYAGFDLAETIEKATKGKVKAADLIRPVRERVKCPTCGKMCNAENLVEKKGPKKEDP